MKYKNIKFQAGRSMIEMLGVLAIMAVITILSIMAYTMAMTNVKVNQIKNDVGVIAQQVRTICPKNDYSNLGTYGNNSFYKDFVLTGLMKSQNALNKGIGGTTDSTTGYYTIYGGLNAAGTGTDYSIKNSFIVGVIGINKKECKLLVVQDWGSGRIANNISLGCDGITGNTGVLQIIFSE